MDTFGINFGLRPLAEVVPWGSTETEQRLHWFGLTDGWYDLVVGDRRVYSAPGEDRGVDHHVSRIWEDLIEIAPFALEALPAAIAARIDDVTAWNAWGDRVMEDVDDLDLVERGLAWWWNRKLYDGPFVNAPRLQLWRLGDALRLHWESAEPARARVQWSSPSGDTTISMKAFRDELLTFNARLLAEMHQRIDAVEQSWNRPDVAIDVRELRREQTYRSQMLERSFADSRKRETAWDAALAALTELEARVAR